MRIGRIVPVAAIAATMALAAAQPAPAIWTDGNSVYQAPESCPVGTFLYLTQKVVSNRVVEPVIRGECLAKNPFLQPLSLCSGTGDGQYRTFGGGNFDYDEVADLNVTYTTTHVFELQVRQRPIGLPDLGLTGPAITAVAFKYNGVDAVSYDGATRQWALNGVPIDVGDEEGDIVSLPRAGFLRTIDPDIVEVRTTNGTRIVVVHNAVPDTDAFFVEVNIYTLTESLNTWQGLCNQDVVYTVSPSYLPSAPPDTGCGAKKACFKNVRRHRTARDLVDDHWDQRAGRLTLHNKRKLWLGTLPGVVSPLSVPVLPEGMAKAALIPPNGAASWRIAFTAPGQRAPIGVSPWTFWASHMNGFELVLRAGGLKLPTPTNPAPFALSASSLDDNGAGNCLSALSENPPDQDWWRVAVADRDAYVRAGRCFVERIQGLPANELTEHRAEDLAAIYGGRYTPAEIEQALRTGIAKLKAETVTDEMWKLARSTFGEPFTGVTLETEGNRSRRTSTTSLGP